MSSSSNHLPNLLKSRKIPEDLEKGNPTPIHKKGDKFLVKNYRPLIL